MTTDKLRAIAEAATPGPWWSDVRGRYVGPSSYGPNGSIETVTVVWDNYSDGHGAPGPADAAFIVAARNTYLAALDVIEAAKAYSPRDDHDYACEYRTSLAGWRRGEPPVIRCQCGRSELDAALDRWEALE